METLEKVVGDLLRARGQSLGVAESCTGGLVGHRLTNVPGSSDYFLASIVAYANSAKETVLGVRRETLRRHGAVSRETAVEMARGVRVVTQSDVGLSITGIAGPGGGSPGKPVGAVFFGLVAGEDEWWRKRVFPGERETIKVSAAGEALAFLWQYLVDPGILQTCIF